MNTLTDIESAAETLSSAEQQELLLFLATRLRRERRNAPSPRHLTCEPIGAWIAEDEADLERLRRT
ncbi:MAG: hypothetical protein ACREU3_01190 [Steroidobacteraceae bacterium]